MTNFSYISPKDLNGMPTDGGKVELPSPGDTKNEDSAQVKSDDGNHGSTHQRFVTSKIIDDREPYTEQEFHHGLDPAIVRSINHRFGYTRDIVSDDNRHCDKIDFKIHGNDIQILELILNEGQKVIAEAGHLLYFDDGIKFTTELGDGRSNDSFLKKTFGAIKRVITKESIFLTHFINTHKKKRCVSFTTPYPGRIISIDLNKTGKVLYAQKGSFLCAAAGTKINLFVTEKIYAGIWGEGFFLEKIEGDGFVFLHGCGACIQIELKGNSIKIEPGSLVAYTEGIKYDIEAVSDLRSYLFGRQNFFLTTLQGHGFVYLQSLNMHKFSGLINSHLPQCLPISYKDDIDTLIRDSNRR